MNRNSQKTIYIFKNLIPNSFNKTETFINNFINKIDKLLLINIGSKLEVINLGREKHDSSCSWL